MPFPGRMLCLATMALSICWQPAAAATATRSLSFPLAAAVTESGAIGGSSILLPSTGSPAFSIKFVLPVDYQTSGTVVLDLYLTTGGGPCQARILPTFLRRTRIGAVQVDSLSGISGGSSLVNFQSLAVVRKRITFQPGTALPGQRPGDALDLKIARLGDTAPDTCGTNVFVEAVDIRYPLQ